MQQRRIFSVRGAVALVLSFVISLGWAAQARAGGGPENVFVVVNAASWASMTVANHFIAARGIPAMNVFYIDWTGGFESIEGDTFRDKIMSPVIDAIEKRGLMRQIDYIVYSSDFPYSINLAKDYANVKFHDQSKPALSLNSATYLWHLVYARIALIMDPKINQYMRDAASREFDPPSHGFRSWYGWGRNGELSESGGQPFMLSTMLAMTSGRGNSVGEAVAYLERSAKADGTFPPGTVYFAKTSDVRSTSRAGVFQTAVSELKKLGVKAQIISTAVPQHKSDVIGAMLGAADFDWGKSKSKILPGAICENFTSFGGIMTEGSGQTPLSEMLRYGAAGSSGTIVEPYAIDAKFPSPLIHVHYARGCTLAESYYQAVFAPPQLLIVGDPLCRPWANIPQVKVTGVKAGQKISGTVAIKASATLPKGGEVSQFELFADGRRCDRARPGSELHWDTTALGDGYHELSVVAIDATPIETQGHTVIPVMVDNNGRRAELTATPSKNAQWGGTLTLKTSAPGAAQIFVLHNGRVLGQIKGAQGEVRVDPRILGTGPINIQALASVEGTRVTSPPVPLVVDAGKPLGPIKEPPAKLKDGLLLQLPSGKVATIDSTHEANWLTVAGLGANESYVLQGYFAVPKADTYQFQIWHDGSLKMSVDGTVLSSDDKGTYNVQKFVPMALAAGLHRVTVSGRSGGEARLRILFGGPGAVSLDGKKFRHQGK